MKQIEANPNTRVAKVNGTRTFFVALNNTSRRSTMPRVRQAANYAIDRKLIIERILQDTATPVNGVLSPDTFGFNPHLAAYGYDAAKAKKLLADAGYPNGVDVTLDIEGALQGDGASDRARCSRRPASGPRWWWATHGAERKWDPTRPRNGDMWLTSWGNGSLDPEDIFGPPCTPAAAAIPPATPTPRSTGCWTPPAPRATRTSAPTMYTPAQAVNADAPWIFLWVPQDIYGVSGRAEGWQPSADSAASTCTAPTSSETAP